MSDVEVDDEVEYMLLEGEEAVAALMRILVVALETLRLPPGWGEGDDRCRRLQ